MKKFCPKKVSLKLFLWRKTSLTQLKNFYSCASKEHTWPDWTVIIRQVHIIELLVALINSYESRVRLVLFHFHRSQLQLFRILRRIHQTCLCNRRNCKCCDERCEKSNNQRCLKQWLARIYDRKSKIINFLKSSKLYKWLTNSTADNSFSPHWHISFPKLI